MLFLLVKAPLPAAGNHFGSVLPTFCAYVERHRRVGVPEHALDNIYVWGSPEKVDTVNLLPWWLSASARSRLVRASRSLSAYVYDCRIASNCQLQQLIPAS